MVSLLDTLTQQYQLKREIIERDSNLRMLNCRGYKRISGKKTRDILLIPDNLSCKKILQRDNNQIESPSLVKYRREKNLCFEII